MTNSIYAATKGDEGDKDDKVDKGATFSGNYMINMLQSLLGQHFLNGCQTSFI